MSDHKNNLLSSPSNNQSYQINPQGKAKNKINLQEANLRTYNNYTIFFGTNLISLLLVLITRFLFYKKPSSRPSTKSFLIFGHILALKISRKFLNLINKDCIENDIKHMDIANY